MIQLSEERCTKCGARLLVNADFCLNCGASLKPRVVARKERTGFVTAAGVLMIFASCLSAVNGIVAFIISYVLLTYHGGFHLADPAGYGALGFGVLAIVSSGMGLTAGALSFKRKQFGFVVSSAALLLIISVWQFLADPFPGGLSGFLARAILPLSLLSLILASYKKREFISARAHLNHKD